MKSKLKNILATKNTEETRALGKKKKCKKKQPYKKRQRKGFSLCKPKPKPKSRSPKVRARLIGLFHNGNRAQMQRRH